MKILKMLTLLGLIALLGARSSSATEPPRYDIKARVDVREKKIDASQTVTFTNPTENAVREMYFYIYPNRHYTPEEQRFMLRFGGYFKVDPFPSGFPEKGMDITSVTVQGQQAAYGIEGEDRTLLKIYLKRDLKPGESVDIAMNYTVSLPQAFGRLGWNDNVIKASHWYPQLAVLDSAGWHTYPFYPFHRPFFADAAYYDVELIVPKDEVVIHTGETKESVDNGDHTKTVKIDTPEPVREFTFAMSPHYRIVSDVFQGVKINSVYLPGNQARAEKALTDVKDLMASYSKFFGPYPYPEFSVVPVPLGYGGEQMANLIFIDERAYRLPGFLERYFDFLISHETGHQWLFNEVGIDEYSEMWLEEATNSFFIIEHLESKYGANADVIQYPKWFEGWEWTLPRVSFRRIRDYRYKIFVRQGFDSSVVKKLSSFQEPSSIFALAYGKGASVVRMLKFYLGPETFDRVWKKVFAQYRFKNLSVKEFQNICEAESGKKLDWFFDQWLYNQGRLDYSVKGVKDLTMVLENRGDIRMPVPVQVTFKDGHEETLTWDGMKNKETLVLGGNSPVVKVVIDPGDNLLDVDRTNNFWPRQIAVKPVPYYFGLYDIPLFLPEDSYNVVVGPEAYHSGWGLKASVQKPYDQNLYAGTDYEFSESLLHSRAGYQLKNVLHSPTTLGLEVSNTTDYDGGEEDLVSGKISLRRELWPAAYSFTDINDHVSLYLIRNQNINDGADFISGRENARNVNYSRRREAITGINLHLNRSGPYPDPKAGYQMNMFYETAGHYLGATQFFHRAALDWSGYQPVTAKTHLALRLKYGWGFPDDKNLYYLGGMDGLRGYDRKTIRGSNNGFGSLEYRFPIWENLNLSLLDNVIGFEALKGVVFFDAGQAWYDSFRDAKVKKDAGIGLRVSVNLGAFLEKIMIRLDAAQPLDAPKNDTHFWFGINQAF